MRVSYKQGTKINRPTMKFYNTLIIGTFIAVSACTQIMGNLLGQSTDKIRMKNQMFFSLLRLIDAAH